MNARRRSRAQYIDHVVAVLADEFSWDDLTTDVCRLNLKHADYGNGYPPWFEFICDEPVIANWRLKSDHDNRHRLRMSYYGGPQNERMEARALAITDKLNAR